MSGWRKSARSHATGNCVDVATWTSRTGETSVLIADTTPGAARQKCPFGNSFSSHRSMLEFPAPIWDSFLAQVRAGTVRVKA